MKLIKLLDFLFGKDMQQLVFDPTCFHDVISPTEGFLYGILKNKKICRYVYNLRLFNLDSVIFKGYR